MLHGCYRSCKPCPIVIPTEISRGVFDKSSDHAWDCHLFWHPQGRKDVLPVWHRYEVIELIHVKSSRLVENDVLSRATGARVLKLLKLSLWTWLMFLWAPFLNLSQRLRLMCLDMLVIDNLGCAPNFNMVFTGACRRKALVGHPWLLEP